MGMRSNQQFRADLLVNAEEEIGCGDVVEWNNNDAAKRTTPENCDPLSGIRAPKENAVTLADAARLQFAGETEGGFSDPLVGPVLCAVSARLNVGSLLRSAEEVGQVVGQRAELHARKGSAFGWMQSVLPICATSVRPTGSQNLLAEGGQGQLHCQVGSAVVLVDHGIHFHDLETQHAAVVGDDLHGQVSFAVGGAATDRSSHAGRVFGIDPIHVEGDVIAGGAPAGHAQGFFDDRAHATLVNIAHGENSDAGTADILFFNGVNVAHSYQYAVFWLHLR